MCKLFNSFSTAMILLMCLSSVLSRSSFIIFIVSHTVRILFLRSTTSERILSSETTKSVPKSSFLIAISELALLERCGTLTKISLSSFSSVLNELTTSSISWCVNSLAVVIALATYCLHSECSSQVTNLFVASSSRTRANVLLQRLANCSSSPCVYFTTFANWCRKFRISSGKCDWSRCGPILSVLGPAVVDCSLDCESSKLMLSK
mmetsp:Transcript_82860/g.130582  ORF Transcript_82860/g.130582 Transcript_82860/m.130582 type:complete len:206 (-) Transcript_82860:522-1139(-)